MEWNRLIVLYRIVLDKVKKGQITTGLASRESSVPVLLSAAEIEKIKSALLI